MFIIHGEKLSRILQITLQPQVFLVIFAHEYYDSLYHEGFLRNKSKDVEQRWFFNTNNKQYTVYVYVHIWTSFVRLHTYIPYVRICVH